MLESVTWMRVRLGARATRTALQPLVSWNEVGLEI